MSLWAVTMVKDELDILPFTLQNLYAQGVDGVIVADNMSTDGTWEWLKALAGAPEQDSLIVLRDEEVGYYQSRKMSALAHQAFSLGAEWVIPFDADEYWYSVAGPDHTIGETLAVLGPHVTCLAALLFNYFPMEGDNPLEVNPFRRIIHRDPQPARLPKVVVRNAAGAVIEQGNHGVVGARPAPSPIRVGHFPWRSPRQFERKVRNGAAAYRATDLPPDAGAHWRSYGDILEAQGPEAIHEVFNTWFRSPSDVQVVRHPVPIHRPARHPV
jgi:hypothetical protein